MTAKGQQAHTASVHKGVAALAALAAAASPATAHAGTDPTATSTFRMLSNPTGGDDFLFRNAIHSNAQDVTNRMFAALKSVLGGQAPELNFVQMGDPSTPTHASANLGQNTINLDPQATEALTNQGLGSAHDSTVYALPHEMAHLRQTSDVLASLVQREGGAQAFTDLVTPNAAYMAHVPVQRGNYDANYADYVKQVQQLGNSWILGTQFGHAPVTFP